LEAATSIQEVEPKCSPKEQESGLAEILARLRPIMAIERELARTGLPLSRELDRARDGLNAAYAFLEKLVGKENN
jgi:hypothetical protein